MQILLSILVASFVHLSSGQNDDGPVLSIPQGTMLGSYASSRDGRPYYMFRAVPYGQFPRRFDLSTLAGPWEGILNATTSGQGCLTSNEFGTTGPYGVEDCLNLDISTPSLPNDANFTGPLPVMVWIPGGGFTLGSSISYGSKYFMDEDVVVVAVNYRLGAFGMLNAGVEGARGNQALKDITVALRWIQTNINFFGGDPNTVTIFGESTGGGTTSLLTLSPMTQGLYHRAIMMSGVASCPQTLHGNPGIKNAKLLAAQLDCPTRNPEVMVECLRNAPALEVASLSTMPIDEFAWREEGLHLTPTIETFSSGPDDASIFINEDPYEIADRGDFPKVPMMIGHMKQEGLYKMTAFLSNAAFVEKLNTEFGRLIPEWLLYYDSAVDPCAVTGKIKEFYFNNQNVTLDLVEEFELLVGDALMNHCTRKMVHAYSKYTQVYMYSFIRPKAIDPEQWPASHGEDLYYMFNALPEAGIEPYFPEIKPGDGDYQFSKDFIKVLVNFARDGEPGAWGTTVWTPLEDPQLFNVLQIDSEQPFMMPVTPEYMDSWRFWDSLKLKIVP